MRPMLKNVTILFVMICSPLILNGCVAALLGAGLGVAADNAGPDDKRHFQEINLQREKDGLPPLTWDQYKHPQTTQQPQGHPEAP